MSRDIGRSHIVSSYTIVKGSMIEESYAVLAAWNFSQSKKENLDRLRKTNFISAKSDSWLRDVAKVLNRRFNPSGRDRALSLLAKAGCELEEWKPILLWHLTRDEFLLKDFLIYWLFPTCYDSNSFFVQNEDLNFYLRNLGNRGGSTEHTWSFDTSHRVATALLRLAADFDLLKGTKLREFASYQLPERSFIYLLHVMFAHYGSAKKIINSMEWRMFLLCPSDVERELCRLNETGKIQYKIIDEVAHLTLPCANAEEYALKMTEYAPGERCEVGYAESKIELLDPKTGEIQAASTFFGILGHSRLLFAWASEDDGVANWAQSHQKMFEAFGGVPHTMVSQCFKQGHVKGHRHGADVHPGYAEIGSHYGTSIAPVREGYAKDDALIRAVTQLGTRYFRAVYHRHTFTSVTEINYALARIVDVINRKIDRTSKLSRLDCWATTERLALKPLPTTAFKAIEWQWQTVHADSAVGLECAYYSVPHRYRGKKVKIKLSTTHVEVFFETESIALHKRDFSKQMTRHIFDEHLPANSVAYLEPTPQKLLLQARFIADSLLGIIEELFLKDTLGNLRRAKRLIQRAHTEIRKYGRNEALPRIHAATEEMRRFNDFRIRHFEAVLLKLRLAPPVLSHPKRRGERCQTATSAH